MTTRPPDAPPPADYPVTVALRTTLGGALADANAALQTLRTMDGTTGYDLDHRGARMTAVRAVIAALDVAARWMNAEERDHRAESAAYAPGGMIMVGATVTEPRRPTPTPTPPARPAPAPPIRTVRRPAPTPSWTAPPTAPTVARPTQPSLTLLPPDAPAPPTGLPSVDETMRLIEESNRKFLTRQRGTK